MAAIPGEDRERQSDSTLAPAPAFTQQRATPDYAFTVVHTAGADFGKDERESKTSLIPLHSLLVFTLCIVIPILGLASYAVGRVNNTFLPAFLRGGGTDFKATATANFKKWNDALATKDYETVAALYSTGDLAFLPTVSPIFIRDPMMAKAYFKDFLKKLPAGTITADNVQSFGDDAYLHTGMYTFQLGPLDARTPVDARFSYMWKKMAGEWKITHHHSSAKPAAARRSLTPAEAELDFSVASTDPKVAATGTAKAA